MSNLVVEDFQRPARETSDPPAVLSELRRPVTHVQPGRRPLSVNA